LFCGRTNINLKIFLYFNGNNINKSLYEI
jgi:hypothetical protein